MVFVIIGRLASLLCIRIIVWYKSTSLGKGIRQRQLSCAYAASRIEMTWLVGGVRAAEEITLPCDAIWYGGKVWGEGIGRVL